MNQPLSDLHVRRGRLLERIALERAVLGEELLPVRRVCERIDTGVARARAAKTYIKRHPGVVALVVAGLVLLRGRQIWQWSKRGFMVWRAWRTWKNRLTPFGL